MKYVLVSSFLVLFFHIVLLCVVVGFFYYFLVVFFSLFLTIILFKTLFVGQPSILLRWCYFNHHILRSLYKFESRIQNFRKISFCHIKFYFLFFSFLFLYMLYILERDHNSMYFSVVVVVVVDVIIGWNEENDCTPKQLIRICTYDAITFVEYVVL